MFVNTDSKTVTAMAEALFKEERSIDRLDGWFISRERALEIHEENKDKPKEMSAALELKAMIENLPLSVSENNIFCGTQRDAFAKSYALINPSFKVENFCGYCDPTAVFDDIEPDSEFTVERINALREKTKQSDYVKDLCAVYDEFENCTSEVAFFFEQVTGHLIPDFRPVLKYGINELIEKTNKRIKTESNSRKADNLRAFVISLECAVTLAERYADLCREKAKSADENRKAQLEYMEKVLRKVPALPAESLFEAIQSFILCWQVMCLEQAPNPFAFSVGNADRIFEPYRKMSGESIEEAAAMLKHFLVFFNVADRSWAISQSLLIGGKDTEGNDLTNDTSYALLNAYYDMNMPQPILSIKLHEGTPKELYRQIGKFLFTPGVLTPSFFNDDSLFEILRANGVEETDLPDCSVAGCQEPLIMGKDNGNTTNTWFNLPKILELTLNQGKSLLTGKEIGTVVKSENTLDILKNIRKYFYRNAEHYAAKMAQAGNGASRALFNLPVPFLSSFMGGLDSGIDCRDTDEQGTKYNGSGCLIHGLSVVADSFVAIDRLVKERPQDADLLIEALKNDFEGYDELHKWLLACPKFGNNIKEVDNEAAEIANNISKIVSSQKNYLGNPFRADWSTPSTHLLYGYWVGATPDGRKARTELNYGVDPLFGEASNGLGFRMLSNMKLPFSRFNGGYASHMGINPRFFTSPDYEGKGEDFSERIMTPLFFNPESEGVRPFYLYVNVTTPETLRKVLENPKKYAPSGVYIMRIHGTFVNFLDLSPDIQQDIIMRLDLESTRL